MLIFSKFEPFLKFQICQNSKLRVSEIVKMAIFEIQIMPKLISRKIGWQIEFLNIHTVGHKFTFQKFMKHSVLQ